MRRRQYELAAEKSFALEIVSFSWVGLWNDSALRRKCVEQMERELNGTPARRSLHGPVMDIAPHTQDNELRRIAHARVDETIEIGLRLGADRFVFHTGINPIITDPAYYASAVDGQIAFWSKVVQAHPGTMICLENMWEPSPSLQRQIITGVSSSQVKACLDIGHVNVYSKVPLRQWVEELSPNIVHFHLNDNNADYDQHLTVGEGTSPWGEFFDLTAECQQDAVFVLELDSIQKQRDSIDYIETERGDWLAANASGHH
ncbi:MAG: sugar phosphate isomerase/epimerase [bacterium]|nr:sugar phosphate isomerase/epimerase [bacterium]